GAMIVLVQPEAGHGLSDDAALGQGVIIRAAKEILVRMRVRHQPGAMPGQLRTKVRAVIAGEPEFAGLHRGIRPADHFELQVGNNVGQRYRRMFQKVLITLSTSLFAAEKSENHGTAWARSLAEGPGQFQYGHTSRSIVIGAVVDAVSVHGPPHA